jgi:hypothetical protein
MKDIVLVRNKQTNHIYQWNGDEEMRNFTNLTTGVTGDIPNELASKAFIIPVMLNKMANENPILLEMIKTLNLELDVEK